MVRALKAAGEGKAAVDDVQIMLEGRDSELRTLVARWADWCS
jgi:hypothetical protein